MRRISFALTEVAFLDGSKDVTRRLGWKDLEPGTELLAVDKCMGLRKGEHARIFGPIRVVSVRRERLLTITADDVRREGFPDFSPEVFVDHFCDAMRCAPDTVVTRIEFRRVGFNELCGHFRTNTCRTYSAEGTFDVVHCLDCREFVKEVKV